MQSAKRSKAYRFGEESDLRITEWPDAALGVVAAIALSLVALQAMELIQWVWTWRQWNDDVRVLGLRYARYLIAPLIGLAGWYAGKLGWRSWPLLLILIGVPNFAVVNWRGVEVLPGTFDFADEPLMPWPIVLACGAVIGFVVGVTRKEFSYECLKRLAWIATSLLWLSALVAYLTVQNSPSMSMFAPTRGIAIAVVAIILTAVVIVEQVWSRSSQ